MEARLQMKNLILIAMTILVTACGGSGGGSSEGGTKHVADTTPHIYLTMLAPTGPIPSFIDAHIVCNFGLAGVQDNVGNSLYLIDRSNQGAINLGCGNASNYTVDVNNSGTQAIRLSIDSDNVQEVLVTLQPGDTYHFQRGF